jgi:small subunit ribosomal protein S20
MPIKHAAFKQMRKDKKRHERNQAIVSELRTVTRQIAVLIAQRKSEEARELLKTVAGKYDRAVGKKIVHRNAAARVKSRLSVRINRLATAK